MRHLLAFGNRKNPDTTAIFNMGSAHTCPSRKLGFCQAYADGRCICYALRTEVFRPAVRAYRNRQARYWRTKSWTDFVRDFMRVVHRRRVPTKALRFNQSGDFRNQLDVVRAEAIASQLSWWGIKTYCYTARRDLDFSRCFFLTVSASGWRPTRGVVGEFRMIQEGEPVPGGYKLCPGDCRRCSRCVVGAKTVVRARR